MPCISSEPGKSNAAGLARTRGCKSSDLESQLTSPDGQVIPPHPGPASTASFSGRSRPSTGMQISLSGATGGRTGTASSENPARKSSEADDEEREGVIWVIVSMIDIDGVVLNVYIVAAPVEGALPRCCCRCSTGICRFETCQSCFRGTRRGFAIDNSLIPQVEGELGDESAQRHLLSTPTRIGSVRRQVGIPQTNGEPKS